MPIPTKSLGFAGDKSAQSTRVASGLEPGTEISETAGQELSFFCAVAVAVAVAWQREPGVGYTPMDRACVCDV